MHHQQVVWGGHFGFESVKVIVVLLVTGAVYALTELGELGGVKVWGDMLIGDRKREED